MTIHMTLRTIEDQGDLYCPVVVCDACQTPIEGQGNAYWFDGRPDVWHSHKGRCVTAWEAQHDPQSRAMSEELSDWLAQLTRNAT